MSTVFAPGARVGAAPLPNAQAAAGGAARHTPAQVHIQAVTACAESPWYGSGWPGARVRLT
eukprot:scaffold29335_cov66-Phaeocystis_antarctica.AAC.4